VAAAPASGGGGGLSGGAIAGIIIGALAGVAIIGTCLKRGHECPERSIRLAHLISALSSRCTRVGVGI
jgi:hypothetical protein